MEKKYSKPFYASLSGTMPVKGSKVLNITRLWEGTVVDVRELEYETISITVDFGVQGVHRIVYWDNTVFWNPLPHDAGTGC